MRRNWHFDDEKFLARKVAEEYILLNLKNGNYYTLEASGFFIFNLIIEDRPLDEIHRELVDRYASISPQVLQKDLFEFIQDLKKIEVLRR